MNNLILISTIEALLIIAIPLLLLYLRGKWPLKMVIICLFVIPVLWYLTYAPIHELSHILGTYLAGGKVVNFKLIPSFWKGEFAVAWVNTFAFKLPWQNIVMTGAPYLLDFTSIIAGGIVLLRNQSKNVLWVGLIFMLLCLRPTFDLVCETIGFYSGFKGDLYHIQLIVGSGFLTLFLLLSLGLSLLFIYAILKRYTGFAESRSVST